jgi:hypothetical protein
MEALTCYMCPKGATSREHAPPKCIFPEVKDAIDGANLRQNLITVPSCEEHNSERSRDDEYLFMALAGSYTSSEVGLRQFTTKVSRAFERQRSKAIEFMRQSQPVRLKRVEQVEWEDGAQVIVRGDRIDSVLDRCARALYLHQTGKRFFGPAQVIVDFTLYHDERLQSQITQAFAATISFFDRHPAKGDNPSVFWFKFEESQATALFLFCFYGQSRAMVRFQKILVAS